MKSKIYLKLKKGILILMCFLLTCTPALAAEPEITEGASAILIDMSNKQILYQNQAEKQVAPASTTKIMTALLALENCDLDEMIAIDPAAYQDVGKDRFGLVENEQLRAEDLLYIMLLCSSNEAASSFAIHIAGSIDAFADMMNAKAVELGALHTHFVNPHGLTVEGHYTTALDMAKIAQAAMQNSEFRKIVSTYHIHIDRVMPPNYELKGEIQQDFFNTNYLLWPTASFYYEWAIGVKTGFTNEAGKCLVSAAQKDGRTLLAVVYKCTTNQDLYPVTKSLFEYGFNDFRKVEKLKAGSIVDPERPVKGGQFKSVAAIVTEGFSYSEPLDSSWELTEEIVWQEEKLEAPVIANQSLGHLIYYLNGQEFAQVELVAANAVEVKEWSIWDLLKIVLILMVIAMFLIILYGRMNRRKMRKQHRRISYYD